MKKEQILGQVRELLMMVAAALVSFGVLSDGPDITPAVGALMGLLTLAWSISAKESWGIVFTVLRKAATSTVSALAVYGVLSDQNAATITAILGQIIILIQSWTANGKGDYTAVNAILLLLIPSFLLLPSCAGFAPGFTSDGCILADYTDAESGQRYSAGFCQDGRKLIRWTALATANQPAQTVQATYFPDKTYVIEYRTDGGWIEWDSKSGVLIGPVPAAVSL